MVIAGTGTSQQFIQDSRFKTAGWLSIFGGILICPALIIVVLVPIGIDVVTLSVSCTTIIKRRLYWKRGKEVNNHGEGGKMYKKIYLGLAIAVVFSVFMLVSSVICFAQGQGQGGGRGEMPAWLNAGEDMPKQFIEAEDANKDGKVSKDEFSGPDTFFEGWDKNGDGFIELSEAPTAESMQAMMGGRGGGEGGAQGGTPPGGGAPGGGAGNAPQGN